MKKGGRFFVFFRVKALSSFDNRNNHSGEAQDKAPTANLDTTENPGFEIILLSLDNAV